MFSNITNEINKITNKLAGSSVATAKNVAKAISQLSEYVGEEDEQEPSVFWFDMSNVDWGNHTYTVSDQLTLDDLNEAYAKGQEIKCRWISGGGPTAYSMNVANLIKTIHQREDDDINAFIFELERIETNDNEHAFQYVYHINFGEAGSYCYVLSVDLGEYTELLS